VTVAGVSVSISSCIRIETMIRRNTRRSNNRSSSQFNRLQQQIASLKRSTNDNIVRLRCPVDPPVYKTDAIYNRVIQLSVSTSGPITFAQLYTALGISISTLPAFSMAVTNLKAWGPAAADSFLQLNVLQTLPLAATPNPSYVRFEDYGTQGAKRSGISVQFPKLIRENWVINSIAPNSVPPPVIIISSIPTVLQFTVRLRLDGTT